MVTTGNVNGGLLLQWFIYPLPLGGVRGRLYLIRVAQALSQREREQEKTIHHLPFTIYLSHTIHRKRKEEHRVPLPLP
jgi:hypothetical protein